MSRRTPLLLAMVGTDHHPFQRLVDWVDAWSVGQPGVECLIQYGTAAPPRHANGTAYAEHDELCRWMDAAAILVCHGGPSTILEARRCGRRPIVVPRSARWGEHVDDHQVRFTGRLARSDLVLTAATQREFDALLDTVVDDPASLQLGSGEKDVATGVAVQRFGDLVSGLFDR